MALHQAFKRKFSEYLPGIVLFVAALVVGMLVYQDYGVSWDEPDQRKFGILTYDFIFRHDNTLITKGTDFHGTGFELLLMFFEKGLHITDSRDVYLMRHLVSHLFFLVGCLAGYVLAYRVFRNKVVASLFFLMLILMPRVYAHSFFNSKDVPTLSILLITLTVAQLAFSKQRGYLFLMAGVLAGFATSIRISGLMLFGVVGLFLLVDVVLAIKKGEVRRPLLHGVLFAVGFCGALYAWWPFLWGNPVGNFVKSFAALSHYDFGANVLFRGQMINGHELPLSYFPVWFCISIPLVWLVLGAGGILLAGIRFVLRPMSFVVAGEGRYALMALMCFGAPVASLLLMHSVIFDDWRHMYFVYPFFAFMGAYAVSALLKTRLKVAALAACGVQVAALAWFMVGAHPNQLVYFNELVPRGDEQIRHRYEMEYWGASYKQGIDHLLRTVPGTIKLGGDFRMVVENNYLLLSESDRKRVEVTEATDADYFITAFRFHPEGYTYPKVVYSERVLGSTILAVYKTKE